MDLTQLLNSRTATPWLIVLAGAYVMYVAPGMDPLAKGLGLAAIGLTAWLVKALVERWEKGG